MESNLTLANIQSCAVDGLWLFNNAASITITLNAGYKRELLKVILQKTKQSIKGILNLKTLSSLFNPTKNEKRKKVVSTIQKEI